MSTKTSKKNQLLKRSRTLVGRKKIDSLSDFQNISMPKKTPRKELKEEKETEKKTGSSTDVEIKSENETDVVVRTKTYKNVRRNLNKPLKTARQNFRFTEELALALENCAEDRRLKKNTIAEIALEQYLKSEGYLKM